MNNTVAIVSSAEFAMQEIKNMLVLLREVDKVECLDYYDFEDYMKKTTPNVIILHSIENDKKTLKLIKKIKEDKKTAKIPIILYPEFAGTDYIVEAFDAGITDMLSYPLKDYELAMRVIWTIQKNEDEVLKENNFDFLKDLGIIDKTTGFFSEEFGLKFLEGLIKKSKENGQNSCLMLLKLTNAINVNLDKSNVANILKTTVRMNDVISIKDDESYYIYLSKSKLNGVYSVYERIKRKINPITSVSSAVVEIQDEIFDDIINVLDYSIETARINGDINIVKPKDFVDMLEKDTIKEDSEDELGISKILNENEDIASDKKGDLKDDLLDEILKEEDNNEPEQTEEKESTQEEQIDLGLKIMQEKIEEIKNPHPKKSLKQQRIEKEEKEIDERNIILYKQAYAKKLNLVIEPLLKKYASKLQQKYRALDANIMAEPELSFMKLNKDDIKLDVEIIYDKVKTIKINMTLNALNSQIESDTIDFEVMDFDYQKFDIVLKTLIEEYENYLSED